MGVKAPDWIPMYGWHEALPLERHGCCDCGLVHIVRWRLINGRLEWKWARDSRATKEVRRRGLHR